MDVEDAVAAERKPKTSRERVAQYRARMKRKGYRLVQFWVPDVTTPEFAAEARRQSLAVARTLEEEDDIDFVESVSEILNDE